MNATNIIFDLDGTLVDSKLEVLNTYKKVISAIVPKQNFNEKDLDFGANINTVLASIYKNETDKITQAKKLFINNYDNSNYSKTSLFTDVLDVLTYLKNNKHNLFIATNKRHTPTLKLLYAKNIAHFFDDVIGNEIEPGVSINKTEMINQLKVKHNFYQGYMVGDTVGDIEAGKNNNMRTIAVLHGYGTLEELSNKNPNYIINTIKELKDFF